MDKLGVALFGGITARSSSLIILRDGHLVGGDNFFYYTGSYVVAASGKWRGEFITHQHSQAIGLNLVFGGRDVGCGFTGVYRSNGSAEVFGTALVGRASVGFKAILTLQQVAND